MIKITFQLDLLIDLCVMVRVNFISKVARFKSFVGISIALMALSCEDMLESKVSSHNSQGSHNVGKNCMECHYSDGPGEHEFELAGTVYHLDTLLVYPNSTIELYTAFQGTGKLKYSLEVDAYGNFYSTRNINFGDGLFPSIKGNGATKHMADRVTTGACNSCHGVTTDYLWTN